MDSPHGMVKVQAILERVRDLLRTSDDQEVIGDELRINPAGSRLSALQEIQMIITWTVSLFLQEFVIHGAPCVILPTGQERLESFPQVRSQARRLREDDAPPGLGKVLRADTIDNLPLVAATLAERPLAQKPLDLVHPRSADRSAGLGVYTVRIGKDLLLPSLLQRRRQAEYSIPPA
jgi:hypothetical protein